jgi:hypothetical protein
MENHILMLACYRRLYLKVVRVRRQGGGGGEGGKYYRQWSQTVAIKGYFHFERFVSFKIFISLFVWYSKINRLLILQ